jgi:hypothetical protein
MPIATQAIDSSGESLLIENVDISLVEKGQVFANFEHKNDSPEVAAIGVFKYAKKILKKGDCETDRQRKFWDQVKVPFIYGALELFDEEEHHGALAIAAMIRYFHNKKEPIQVGASIEGVTLERDGNILKRAMMKKVAITLTPCNKQCWIDVMTDKESEEIVKKFESSSISTVTIDSIVLSDDAIDFTDMKKAIDELNKTLEAGMGNVAPGQLTGGAALVREQIVNKTNKNKIKAAIRDWDRKRPLKEVLKAALPEISDTYIEHFADVAEDLALKKGEPKLTRINQTHSHINANHDQKNLVEGLYFDNKQKFSPGHDSYRPDKQLHILRNDNGQDVFLKGPSSLSMGENQESQNHNASHYSDIARNVFGMEKHVPTTAAIKHPEVHGGLSTQAVEYIKGSKTPLESQEAWDNAHKKATEDGSLHKLAILDHVLQNSDRHLGNVLIHPDGHLLNIDNDYAFSHVYMKPDYLENDSSAIHPEASKWIQSVDPKVLALRMKHHGFDKKTIQKSLGVLKSYQADSKRPITMQNAWDRAQAVSDTINQKSLLLPGDDK